MKTLILSLAILCSLAACNDVAPNPQPQPTVTVTPAPLPSESPSPRPSVTPTPTTTPSPTPTITPSPSPTITPSPTPTSGPIYSGPAELEKYVLKFVDDAKIQGKNVLPDMKNPMLTIQIKSLDQYGSTVIGLCESGGGQRRVTFDPDFWNVVSETQRELLVHHELGHCVLYRPHRSDLLSTGKYASIMYPVIMTSSTYTSNFNYYQNELFTFEALEDKTAPKVHICNQSDLF